MILPLTPLKTQGLFLHPLEFGQALWLPWPMEYSRGNNASAVSSLYCPSSFYFLRSWNARSLKAPTWNPASYWEKPRTHGKFMQRCSGSWASIQHRVQPGLRIAPVPTSVWLQPCTGENSVQVRTASRVLSTHQTMRENQNCFKALCVEVLLHTSGTHGSEKREEYNPLWIKRKESYIHICMRVKKLEISCKWLELTPWGKKRGNFSCITLKKNVTVLPILKILFKNWFQVSRSHGRS